MEEYTKEEVMNLSDDDLLIFINLMLDEGYTISKLANEGKIIKSTTLRRLKNHGYVYDKSTNSYIPATEVENKHKESKPKTSKRQKTSNTSENKGNKEQVAIINQDDILKTIQSRLDSLELKLNEVINTNSDKTEEKQEFKPIIFKSKQHPRNYPLHTEVVELLMQVSEDHSHLKVKDIVNHALYIGLQQIKDSNSIE